MAVSGAASGTAAIELEVSHRPWPLPAGSWVMFQSWRDLLFAHWRVPAAELRARVPDRLTLQEFDGSAWLGVTPFLLTGLRIRPLPPLPAVSEFPEVNLRTYVSLDGRPGILFFSLDAASTAAVLGARLFNRLPYHRARMEIRQEEGWTRYRSRRLDNGGAAFVGRYRPTGPVSPPAPGSLEHFLTERYALYAPLRSGGILTVEIHHRPWPLQPAEAVIETNTLPEAAGLRVAGEPLLHYSARQDTLIWPPKPV